MTLSMCKGTPYSMKFCIKAKKYSVTWFPLGNLKQLRWFRTDKRGLLGGVVKTLFGLPKDYSSLLPISQKSTHGYLPPEDTSGHQQQLQELCLGIGIAISTQPMSYYHNLSISRKIIEAGLNMPECLCYVTHTYLYRWSSMMTSGDPGYMTQPLKAALQYFYSSSLWVTLSLPYL